MISLDSATFLVRDLDEAITFFIDALGFALRQDETFEGGWRRVVVGPAEGGTGLVLAVAPADSDVVGRQGGGDVGFFLRTDDFDVQYARMLKYGVHFREAPRFESYGTVAIFEDLYGMPWDLIGPVQGS
jgi:catechol 2,3-dioxygenase-like lactoylglutathione lyase family enzyme